MERSNLQTGYGIIVIAPEGWPVPTHDDWKKLEMFLGMSASESARGPWRGTDEGGKLKETGMAHWKSPNYGATDEFNIENCQLEV
jgi:uncharacterized protein (TIGR02145 family)